MTTDSQETLVILKPHKILQIISIFIEMFWIGTILRSLQPFFFKVDSYLSPLLLLLLLLFISIFFWIILNTINTQIVIRTDCIIMRGVLWRTYIAWDKVERIQLIYNYKTRGRSVEINAPLRSFSLNFNSKISFDTNFHRNVRKGVHYVLELAKQHNIPVKTAGLSSRSYQEWKEWAKN
jgi:hypothetical protein